MHYVLFLFLLFNFDILADDPISNSGLNQSVSRKFPRRRSIVSLMFSNGTIVKSAPTNRTMACRWLRGYKHQNKLCRNRKGFSDVLLRARHLAVTSCEELFQYDRWNCSYKKSLFKKIYRETAFLHALSSSAIMYSAAKACSAGKLSNCKCAQPGKDFPDASQNWKWGGCGDNVLQARKLTSKFLQLRQKGDGPTNILNYNSLLGLALVAEGESKTCKCHGISASCAMKTCWRSLGSFSKIAGFIKRSYHAAVQQTTRNTIGQSVKKVATTKDPKRLLYLAASPSYCSVTRGRRCKDTENCATLCCGRGFDSEEVEVSKQCRCRWQECCFDVVCDTCSEVEVLFKCK